MQNELTRFAKLLDELGIVSKSMPLESRHHGQDILPLSCSSTSTAELQRTADWLNAQHDRGAQLTVGTPIGNPETNRRWMGERLAFCTGEIKSRVQVGLVSSRLTHDLESHRRWFQLLRVCCAEAAHRDETLLFAKSTAVDEYITRAAHLFHTHTVRLICPDDDHMSLVDWLHSLRQPEMASSRTNTDIYLSPQIGDTDTKSLDDTSLPIRDRATIALSDRVHVFRLRRNGHIDRLLRQRLQDPAWPTTSIRVARGTDCVPEKLADEMQDRGAVAWSIIADEGDDAASPPVVVHQPTQSAKTHNNFPIPNSNRWTFLSHCTRRCVGPWPDQSYQDFLDDLILDRSDSDHSQFATLRRIVRQRRLIASSRLNRGQHDVVSFSAVSLQDLRSLRTFRPHLAKWDFEPYGLCIDRMVLESMGARAVIYGGEKTWQSLAEHDQPFFQKTGSESNKDDTIDWSCELEWRHLGDVRLDNISQDSIFLFVPTEAEAAELQKDSPWPITILSEIP